MKQPRKSNPDDEINDSQQDSEEDLEAFNSNDEIDYSQQEAFFRRHAQGACFGS
jgi:hypothetical protein